MGAAADVGLLAQTSVTIAGKDNLNAGPNRGCDDKEVVSPTVRYD